MNKRTFYKERKINNRCFDFLSKQNIIVPLILDINERICKETTSFIIYLFLVGIETKNLQKNK